MSMVLVVGIYGFVSWCCWMFEMKCKFELQCCALEPRWRYPGRVEWQTLKRWSGGRDLLKKKRFPLPPPQGDVLWFDPNFETATFVFISCLFLLQEESLVIIIPPPQWGRNLKDTNFMVITGFLFLFPFPPPLLSLFPPIFQCFCTPTPTPTPTGDWCTHEDGLLKSTHEYGILKV